MINKLKKLFYFPIAYYFRFFAKIQLAIWKPIIIVVTGSSGKTTLLHLIESQLQEKARYSHQANSSYGIPFDILGLRRKNLTPEEWVYLFLTAPFTAFKNPPKEKLYIVEADCDRPYEGKFLAELLKPEVTLWTNVSRTHTVNFDSIVKKCHCEDQAKPETKQSQSKDLFADGKGLPHQSADWFAMTQNRRRKTTFKVEDAIAYEFGYFLEETKSLAIVNGDSELIKNQLNRSKAKVEKVTQTDLNNYKVFKDHTEFRINGKDYSINALLPKEASYSILMTLALLDFLKIKPDLSFSKFSLPPGRCSFFKGINNTIIIDSSYNATPDGVMSILGMLDQYPSDKKWLVLGDMIELGNEEQEEHEKLGSLIASMKLVKVILVGPRVSKYTYEILKQVQDDKVVKFLMPKGTLDYLINNLKGGEVVLFKGARFLEGIIEHLLADKNDVKKLCRREKIWQLRRKQWGL